MRAIRVLGVVAVAVTLVMTGARAATWIGVDISVRDGSGDVLRSDGGGAYVRNGDFSRIQDAAEPNDQNIQDVLWVEPWGKRHLVIQSPQIEGGAPIECANHGPTVGFFDRRLNADWFTTMQALPDGSSLPLEGNIRCSGSSAGYYVDYPPYRSGDGVACGRVTRVNERTYDFDMPASCLADVYRFRTVRGKVLETKIATAVAGPFAVRASLE